MSVLNHVLTVVLLWAAVILITWGTKKAIIASISNWEYKKEKDISFVKKVARTVNIITNVFAFSTIILIVFFLSNPTARPYNEIGSVGEATIDETFVVPDKTNIEESNNIQARKEGEKKEQEAEADNNKAIKEIFKLTDSLKLKGE